MEAKKQIREHLQNEHPRAVRKAKRIFGFKYPKLLFLCFTIFISYFLFSGSYLDSIVNFLSSLDYLGVFLAGIILAFGFTAAFGVGFFVLLEPQNILLASLAGGLGGLFADIVIFKVIRFSFQDEFDDLRKSKTISKIKRIVSRNKHVLFKHYFLYVFTGIVIATPLPDEIGVSMLAGLTTIKPYAIAIISFTLHSLFLFLLFIGISLL